MDKLRQVFTTGQVAKICKVAPRTVSKWVDAGHLTGTRDPQTGNRFVTPGDLVEFLQRYGMPVPEELTGVEPTKRQTDATIPEGGKPETQPLVSGEPKPAPAFTGERKKEPSKTPREQTRAYVEDVVVRVRGASHTPESLLADQLPKWTRMEDIQAALDDMEREGKVRRHKGKYVAADYRPSEDEIEDEVQDHVGREYAKIPKKDRAKLDYDAWERRIAAAYRKKMGYATPI